MAKMIFVNFPVKDLVAATAFYKAIGFTQNMQFSDETASGMVWSDTIHVMLLTHNKWRQFTQRPFPAEGSSEVMVALSFDSREAVDAINEAATQNGGSADINPAQDLGFMYNRAFADLDGHIWEAFYMDMSAVPPAQ